MGDCGPGNTQAQSRLPTEVQAKVSSWFAGRSGLAVYEHAGLQIESAAWWRGKTSQERQPEVFLFTLKAEASLHPNRPPPSSRGGLRRGYLSRIANYSDVSAVITTVTSVLK